MKLRIALGGLAGIAAVFVVVATTRADPNLHNVPKHRHYIKTATGELVQVGPRLCDDPNLQRAFDQFHNNIHVVSPTGIGPAAPGLHNLQGAEVASGPC